jgi:hypothetical protein
MVTSRSAQEYTHDFAQSLFFLLLLRHSPQEFLQQLPELVHVPELQTDKFLQLPSVHLPNVLALGAPTYFCICVAFA